jgi:hypothetical protein
MSVSFGGFSFNLGGGPEEGPVLSAGSPLSGVDGDADGASVAVLAVEVPEGAQAADDDWRSVNATMSLLHCALSSIRQLEARTESLR